MNREIRIRLSETQGVTEKFSVEVWENGKCVGGTYTDSANGGGMAMCLQWLEGGRKNIWNAQLRSEK